MAEIMQTHRRELESTTEPRKPPAKRIRAPRLALAVKHKRIGSRIERRELFVFGSLKRISISSRLASGSFREVA